LSQEWGWLSGLGWTVWGARDGWHEADKHRGGADRKNFDGSWEKL
jgi:hypothetical protein